MKKTEIICDRCGRLTTEEIVRQGERFNLHKDLCSLCQKEYEETIFIPYMKAREAFFAQRGSRQ